MGIEVVKCRTCQGSGQQERSVDTRDGGKEFRGYENCYTCVGTGVTPKRGHWLMNELTDYRAEAKRKEFAVEKAIQTTRGYFRLP